MDSEARMKNSRDIDENDQYEWERLRDEVELIL